MSRAGKSSTRSTPKSPKRRIRNPPFKIKPSRYINRDAYKSLVTLPFQETTYLTTVRKYPSDDDCVINALESSGILNGKSAEIARTIHYSAKYASGQEFFGISPAIIENAYDLCCANKNNTFTKYLELYSDEFHYLERFVNNVMENNRCIIVLVQWEAPNGNALNHAIAIGKNNIGVPYLYDNQLFHTTIQRLVPGPAGYITDQLRKDGKLMFNSQFVTDYYFSNIEKGYGKVLKSIRLPFKISKNIQNIRNSVNHIALSVEQNVVTNFIKQDPNLLNNIPVVGHSETSIHNSVRLEGAYMVDISNKDFNDIRNNYDSMIYLYALLLQCFGIANETNYLHDQLLSDINSRFIIFGNGNKLTKNTYIYCFLKDYMKTSFGKNKHVTGTTEDDKFIHTLCTASGARNKGHCSSFVSEISKMYYNVNLLLKVRPDNKGAYRCYEKNGFNEVKTPDGKRIFYDEKERRITYVYAEGDEDNYVIKVKTEDEESLRDDDSIEIFNDFLSINYDVLMFRPKFANESSTRPIYTVYVDDDRTKNYDFKNYYNKPIRKWNDIKPLKTSEPFYPS